MPTQQVLSSSLQYYFNIFNCKCYINFQTLQPIYEVTISGLCLSGIGTAALLVASFSGAQKSALENLSVTADDLYALMAGIWTSAFALGNFIGPTLGGFLVDYIGFRNATTVFQVLILHSNFWNLHSFLQF